MTTLHKVDLALFIVFFLLSMVFLDGWVKERDARSKAETVASDSAKTIAAQNAAIAMRDQVATAKDQQLAHEAATVDSLTTALVVLQQHQPAVPQSTGQVRPGGPAVAPAPIATISRADLSPEAQARLPDAPSFAILTPDQSIALARQQLSCDATANDAVTCKADLASRTTQLAAETEAAQAWETAAKGGTKFHRFLGVLKLAACSAAGSAIGATADKSHPATGSAIGATAAVAGCSMF